MESGKLAHGRVLSFLTPRVVQKMPYGAFVTLLVQHKELNVNDGLVFAEYVIWGTFIIFCIHCLFSLTRIVFAEVVLSAVAQLQVKEELFPLVQERVQWVAYHLLLIVPYYYSGFFRVVQDALMLNPSLLQYAYNQSKINLY